MNYDITDFYEYTCVDTYTYSGTVIDEVDTVCRPNDNLQNTLELIPFTILIISAIVFSTFIINIIRPNK